MKMEHGQDGTNNGAFDRMGFRSPRDQYGTTAPFAARFHQPTANAIPEAQPSRPSRALSQAPQRPVSEEPGEFVQFQAKHRAVIRGQLLRCRSWLGHEDAEELEQTIWVAAWVGLPLFRGEATVSTWLTAIARRVIGAWLRRAKTRRIALAQFACEQQIDGEPGWEAKIVRRLTIQDALTGLPPNEREAVHLRYFENQSDEQIAKTLSIPLGTVKGRIRTGLRHLRTLV